MSDSPLLLIGRIRKAHGIRGEVSVDCHADSPSIFHGGVFLQAASASPVFYDVDAVRAHHGAVLLRLAGVPDRTAAENLRGYEIRIPESRLPAPDEDEIYLYQILGLAVLCADEAGNETNLGAITAVVEPAGQELWTIAKDGEEDVLFPAAPEFVLGFDLDKGVVRIAPPPGLIELYRP